MSLPPMLSGRQRVALVAAVAAPLLCLVWLAPADAHAALARAAGKEATAQGGSGGKAGGGFAELFEFLDTLATHFDLPRWRGWDAGLHPRGSRVLLR